MNTELMAAWNATNVDGKRWEDLSIAEQYRLEDFAGKVGQSAELQERIEELEGENSQLVDDLETARTDLEEAQEELRELKKAG